jgi:hypothetical protein
LDHSSNINHPAPFHVRDDGWMGACLTFVRPITQEPGRPLQLRYGLYVHRGAPVAEHLDRIWQKFDQQTRQPLLRESAREGDRSAEPQP